MSDTTDTWALDTYRDHQRRRMGRTGRMINDGLLGMYANSVRQEQLDSMSPYEPWTDADKDMIDDNTDKTRVFWADQFDLVLTRESAKDTWLAPILELHRNDKGECAGCDYGGYDGEPPEWPCRTIHVAVKYAEDYEPRFATPTLRMKANTDEYITIPVHHG